MKGKKIYSIVRFKCPHCHEGQFLKGKHPYDLKYVGDLLEECPVCKRSYIKEPGFYYGAMYVAYGLAVGTAILMYGTGWLIFPSETDVMLRLAFMAVMIAFLGPYIFALSKSTYANIFYKYKGPVDQEAGA